MKPKHLICETVFGSHLYGTATETSDRDFKGIFLPTPEEILLGRIPRTYHESPRDDSRKNVADELDSEYYSLHHFLKLAAQGQTVAIDMLFTPAKQTKTSSQYGWIWDMLVENRSRFISKRMNAFVGYARSQAAKYGLKGERLNRLRLFERITGHILGPDQTKLSEWWDRLPKDDERKNPQGIRELQIAGKWYGETTSVTNAYKSVERALQKYGKRAKAAASAEGTDWKALSHAVRVSMELLEILATGELCFPLGAAETLLEIKRGEMSLECTQQLLDDYLEAIETRISESSLPERADTRWCDEFLMGVLKNHLRRTL